MVTHMNQKILITIVLLGINTSLGASVLPRLPVHVLLKGNQSFIGDRIVGGTEASPGEFPYQISLQLLYSNAWYLICGGSIYNKDYILTAAHCVYGESASSLRIVAGDHDLLAASGNEQARTVSSIRMHPNYAPGAEYNDIALLKISTSLTLNSWVAAIQIPQQDTQTNPGTNCVVTGWGTTSPGDENIPNILRKVTIPVVSDATCRASYVNEDITDSMLCAGFANGGADSCQGDSGGPLMIQGTRTQVGIVSWGYSCAQPKYYGVYTEVSAYTEWIKSIAGNPTEVSSSTIGVGSTATMGSSKPTGVVSDTTERTTAATRTTNGSNGVLFIADRMVIAPVICAFLIRYIHKIY